MAQLLMKTQDSNIPSAEMPHKEGAYCEACIEAVDA